MKIKDSEHAKNVAGTIPVTEAGDYLYMVTPLKTLSGTEIRLRADRRTNQVTIQSRDLFGDGNFRRLHRRGIQKTGGEYLLHFSSSQAARLQSSDGQTLDTLAWVCRANDSAPWLIKEN